MMQDRGQNAGNVVILSEWRAVRLARHAGQDVRPVGGPGVPSPAAPGAIDPAIARLYRARRAWRPQTERLITALSDLDAAVLDLGQTMSDLEGRVVRLHDSLGHALTRLEAQRRQNARVMACLESGDLAEMEACRSRIRAERRAAPPRH
ncbi:hypothetical protein ACFOGJ_13075 [Marinibaculum pumilum]|uniref:Uncharacterized protein n=1 Tax=Marinibaculum pumilum TaxID=1766165 RepID=A0ABV7L1F6_9PROT